MTNPTITNTTPFYLMFSLPVFYRVQANFSFSNRIRQFDFISKESINPLAEENIHALFRVIPKKLKTLETDLYERSYQ